MWSAGCQSFVAILRAKGKERSLLTVGMMSRPLDTAREPFCLDVSAGMRGVWKIGAGTYRRAEVFLEIYYDQCGLERVSRHPF